MIQALRYPIALIILVFVLGCSTPNMYLASSIHSQYQFKKKEKIIVALPNNPTETERNSVPLIKQYLTDNNFHIVDSIKHAERLLTFHITENTVMTVESNVITKMIGRDDAGKPRETHSIENITRDSGYTAIAIALHDIASMKPGQSSSVWQAYLHISSELWKEYPGAVLDNVMKMYGKNEVHKGRFKKPKS